MAVDPDLRVRLVEAVKLQSLAEPDMYLVSGEGAKIPAHRSVMSLFSPLLRSLLLTSPQHLTACIIISESSTASLASVVAIFYSGLAPATPSDDEAVTEIEQTCGLLGFPIDLKPKLSIEVVSMDSISENINHDRDIDEEMDQRNTAHDSKECMKDNDQVFNHCEKCDYSSELPTSLMTHYSVEHFGANISQLIDFYFQLNFSTGSYDPCKECDNVLVDNTRKEVIEHIGVYHMKILDVLKTNKIKLPNLFRSKPQAGGEEGSSPIGVPKQGFQCNICTVTPFSTRTEFQDHLSGVHFWSELVGEYGNKYSKACSLCQFKFQTLQQLAKHIGTIHDKVGDYYAGKQASLKKGGGLVVQKLSCSFKCDESFPDQDVLKMHYISRHFADELVRKFGSYESQCSLCFAWLNSKEELAVHIGNFHGKVNEMIVDSANMKLDEKEIKLLPSEGRKNEELMVKKMIEKSKKLMNERNLQLSRNIIGEKKSVSISMRK